MPFLALLPLIIVGMIITVTTRANVRKQEEARRRAAAFDERQYDPQKPPVRPQTQQPQPTVKTPAYTWMDSSPRYGQNPNAGQKTAQKAPTPQKMHPQHEYCAIRPEQPVKSASQHPQHEDCALRPDTVAAVHATAIGSGEKILDLTSENILRGVVFAEVFGKPKALR